MCVLVPFNYVSCGPFNYESQSLLRLITASTESLPINPTVIPAVCAVRISKIPFTEHELYISRNQSN